jgi:hypothetical protein
LVWRKLSISGNAGSDDGCLKCKPRWFYAGLELAATYRIGRNTN